MNVKTTKSTPCVLFHIWLTASCVFLLPVKFGTMTGVPEVPMSWHSSFSILFENCPPIFFPVIACVLFLSAVVAGGLGNNFDFGRRSLLPLLWLFLALISLLGFVNASVADYPIIYVLHVFGLAIFAFSILLTLELDDGAGKILLRALIAGNCFILFFSLHQLLFGFEQSLEFVKGKELETGFKVSNDLWLRLVQTRVFAPFALCNSLAANIILTLPIIACGIFFDKESCRFVAVLSVFSLFFIFYDRFGFAMILIMLLILSLILALILTSFYDEYWRFISRPLALIFTLFALYILMHTFSRGAVLALGLSLITLPFFLKINRKIKIAYIVLMTIIFVIFFVIVNQNRGLLKESSLHVRVDYWLRAAEIFFSNPIFGTGWGDFFHDYTVIKKFPGTEAPHSAHHMIMDFASQCGILGLLAISLLTLSTVFFSAKFANKDSQNEFCQYAGVAIFCGIFAWNIHSLTDINFQVPGTVATVIILSLLAVENTKFEKIKFNLVRFANFAVLIIVFPVLLFAIRRAVFENKFEKLHRICDPITMDDANPENFTPKKMEDALKEAVNAAPYSPFPWASAGLYAQRRGMWDTAEKFFEHALKRSPERASFYHRLAIAQLKMGKFSSAANNLKKATELFPNNQEYNDLYHRVKNASERKK